MSPYDWRFYLSWNGRISRRDYMAGQQVIGIAGAFAWLVLFALSMFWTPLATGSALLMLFLIFVAALSILGSSLLIRRAHDLGWPAALSMTAMLVPLVFGLALFARSGAFGPQAEMAQWLEVATSAPLLLVALAFAGVLSLLLMFKQGHPEANRYGPAPV